MIHNRSLLVLANSLVLIHSAMNPAELPAANPSGTTRIKTAPGFERYQNVRNPKKLLADPELKSRIKSLLGKAEAEFWRYAEKSDMSTSDDEIFIVSHPRGEYLDKQSFLGLQFKSKKVFAGYILNRKIHVYGATKLDDLPGSLRNYVEEQDDKFIDLGAKKSSILFERAK